MTLLRGPAGSAFIIKRHSLGDRAGNTIYFPHLLKEPAQAAPVWMGEGWGQGKERARKENEAFTGLLGTLGQKIIPLSEGACHKCISL